MSPCSFGPARVLLGTGAGWGGKSCDLCPYQPQGGHEREISAFCIIHKIRLLSLGCCARSGADLRDRGGRRHRLPVDAKLKHGRPAGTQRPRESGREVLRLEPKFSVEAWKARRGAPTELSIREAEALRKAGLPE